MRLIVLMVCLIPGLPSVVVRAAGTQPTSAPISADAQLAVVDLDKVAHDLGWLDKMQANLEKYKTQLQADLKRYNEAVTFFAL